MNRFFRRRSSNARSQDGVESCRYLLFLEISSEELSRLLFRSRASAMFRTVCPKILATRQSETSYCLSVEGFDAYVALIGLVAGFSEET